MRPSTLRRFAVAVAAALAVLCVACQRKPLPEQGTAAELLYSQRCGECHRAYDPSSMTSAMWEIQVNAMRVKMLQAGRAPLSPGEQRAILDYLQRNAGAG